MEETTYSIWLQNSTHNQDILNLINRFAKEESKDSFFPHVTLVTHISSEEEALSTLSKLRINKDEVVFDKISTGDTFFQKLYLEASDNSYFFNAVLMLEGWPSLWVPHLSLSYGDELPKSFDLGELNAVSYTHLTLPTKRIV